MNKNVASLRRTLVQTYIFQQKKRTANSSLFSYKILIFILCSISLQGFSQDVTSLIKNVKAKLDKVNDYVADGRMRTDVAFIKAPASGVKIFYKRPNKFKLKRDSGISLLPKGGILFNMNSLLTNTDFLALDAGESTIEGIKVKVVKMLPSSETSDIVLTTLYINETNLLILKSSTTTKENGTFEMEMKYGKFSDYGLPDKVIFSFNTKDYKLPKGISMEFDTDEKKTQADQLKNKKGKIEITYSSYIINKGVSDAEFK